MEEMKKEQGCCTAEAKHNGPLLVKGCMCVKREGEEDRTHDKAVAFCRCSKSKNQPYCDGSHMKHPFE